MPLCRRLRKHTSGIFRTGWVLVNPRDCKSPANAEVVRIRPGTFMEKVCLKCNNKHIRDSKFCSLSCAKSRTWTEEQKKLQSIAAKNSKKVKKQSELRKIRIDVSCPICQKISQKRPCDNKACSLLCREKLASNNRKGKTGGYRPGSGRSKSGYYKGIYCGSTYELCWVIYELDHERIPERFEGFLTNGKLKYFPDFIKDNVIIEIKGYHTEDVDLKTKLAKENGYDIKILYKKDLIEQFNWVQSKYNTKNYYELYDQYKPKYQYTCDYCNKLFDTDVKRKTNKKYCSKFCSCKGNKHYPM